MTLKEMYALAKEKGKSDLCRFMRDMKRAGLSLRHYRGRWYWEGPAVMVDDLQTAMMETRVSCQFDQMGKGYVVYPKQSL